MNILIRSEQVDNVDDVAEWLHEHVGTTLHSKPTIYWKGDGWFLRLRLAPIRPNQNPYRWSIDIDDPELATLFLLRWT